MTRARRWFIAFTLLALVVIVAVVWLRRGRDGDADAVRTELVGRGDVLSTVTATGTISAVTTVQVGSQVSGIVERLYADYNSPVKRGQLLAELDPTPFEAQVEQRRADRVRAEVEKRNAEIGFHRQERLLAEGLAPQADFDSAKAAYDAAAAGVQQADAALRQSQTNLSYTKIYSPIDGVVVARQYDIGQTVAASFQAPTLFTIAEDLTKMQVQADVDQSDIGRVAIGQTVRFTVDAYADEEFTGSIAQIRLNATQNANVVTYPVIVDVPNPGERLKPKMTADVIIEVARVAGVLRVPNAALRFQPVETGGPTDRGGRRATAASGPVGGAQAGERPGGGVPGAAAPGGTGSVGAASVLGALTALPPRHDTVYLVDADGRSRPVSVKTGISDGRYTAIVGGDLKEGDRVAVGLSTARSENPGSFPGMSPTQRRGGRNF